MENKTECKIYNLDGVVYVIPIDKIEDFESISYYDRERKFDNYILEDGAVIEEVVIDNQDLDMIINGW